MCPELSLAKWQYYDGTGYVEDEGSDGLVRCSDCAKFPAELECCKYLTSRELQTSSLVSSELLQSSTSGLLSQLRSQFGLQGQLQRQQRAQPSRVSVAGLQERNSVHVAGGVYQDLGPGLLQLSGRNISVCYHS